MGERNRYLFQNGRAALSIALAAVFVMVMLVQVPASVAGGDATARAGEVDVILYFHSGGNMSTVAPTSQASTPAFLRDGDSVNFTTGLDLSQDLLCLGKDNTGGSGKALWVNINTTVGPGDANLTVSIFDADYKVAEAKITKAKMRDNVKVVPFINPAWDSYTFKKGGKLRVLFVAQTEYMITLNYDHILHPGNLMLTCNQMVTDNATLKIMDSQGKETQEFMPNDPRSDKTIHFQGSASDILGNYDIEQVIVTVKDPSSNVVLDNATSVSRQGDHDFSYSYEWKFGGNMTAGIYTVFIQIHDNSGNVHNVSGTFSFSSYGVYVSSAATTADGYVGASAELTGRVQNMGGASDTISITCSSNNNWPVGVDQSTVSLAGGASEEVKVTVTVPTTASPGDADSVLVTATSVSSGKTGDITITVNAVSAYNFKFEAKGSVNTQVSPGQTRTITLELKNQGLQEDTYEVYINKTPPSNWTYSLYVPGGQKEAVGSKYLDYKVTLAPQASKDIMLNVSVSALPLIAEATVEVGATSLGDTAYDTSHYLKYTLTTVIDMDQFVKFVGDSKKTAGIASNDDLSYMRTDFQVYVKNPQSTSMAIKINFVANTGWTAAINPSSFTLGGDEEKTVTVGVNPPKGDVAGDKSFSISVNEESSTPRLSKVLSGKVTIPQIHKFRWSVSSNDQTIKDPGDKLTYKVLLENKGNVQTESVRLELNAPEKKGWNAKLSEDSVTKTIIKGGNVTLAVEVSVDSDVDTSSKYSFTVRINGTSYESEAITANTDIAPKYLSFFTDFWWVPLGLVVVIGVAIFLRYKQTKA